MELLCHYMAQKLCAAAGKKYWFCNDYDVEMVDFDPDSGEVRIFHDLNYVNAPTCFVVFFDYSNLRSQ